ncbi:hypothetical protein IVG45_21705 [Methylomonas sp. LL1]|uniref:hypothetical protein n=1 Tax=Methylomonas sp. LL1 TaxID=2785785 RepID=UPI0018C3E4A1|nr:hypothetical protein [Methylomonas sp. LL1]QPK63382.1 hypothetical protein IVG45_21705 [Methylomonas sp. LL1]
MPCPDTTFVSVAGQLYVNDQSSDFTGVQSSNSAVTPSDIAKGAQFLMPWSVSETVGLSGAESVTARVNNILVAGVFSGFGAAFIETNLISLGIQTTPVVVPVPAAFWMFGSSLLGVLVIGRRKSEA